MMMRAYLALWRLEQRSGEGKSYYCCSLGMVEGIGRKWIDVRGCLLVEGRGIEGLRNPQLDACIRIEENVRTTPHSPLGGFCYFKCHSR